MITMTEIAKLTQVSQPTVSRVLNGSKTVSADIRERVLACAREHNYQFNALAKSLQGGKTQLLGVLLTDVSNSFFADLAKQVEAKARELGYSIILFNSDYSSAREQEYLDVVRRYRVDGVLAVPVLEGGSLWPGCAQRLDVPVVALTRQVEGLDCVYLDHVEAAAQVARHMTQRGYRRFLFIGQDGCPKCEGFRQELAARGLASQLTVLEGQDDEQLKKELRSHCQRPGPRTGIFANNDVCALRVLSILRALGIAVPGRVGVMGFDDTYMGRYLHPALSSVSQPIEQIAQQAVSRLAYRIDNPGPAAPLNLALPAALVLREST